MGLSQQSSGVLTHDHDGGWCPNKAAFCKAMVVVDTRVLQVVGTRGHCGGSGGQSPPLVEGG